MKTIAKWTSVLGFAVCGVLGTGCADVDAEGEESAVAEDTSPYAIFGVTSADRPFLTELNRYASSRGNATDYPMCVYNETATHGVAVHDPSAVLRHMTTVVNTWLPHLAGRWSWKVPAVSFRLRATTEAGCAAEYGGFKPFRVSTWVGGAFGGLPRAIQVRFPGNSINAFADGTSNRQAILHEVGHVLNLAHTLDQATNSVLDYDDMYRFNGISGDDVTGLTHSWKFLSGQMSASACEFGYVRTDGACVASGGDLRGKRIRNLGTGRCVRSGGAGANVSFGPADCDAGADQRFDITRNNNGTWKMISHSAGQCMRITGSADGAALQQVACNQQNADQNFTLLQNEDGTFKIMSELTRKLLKLQNGVFSQSNPAGSSFQSWRIEAQ